MFAGHRVQMLWQHCDRRRFERLVDEFEPIVRDA
jgi:hypothetical protein